eukprot:scaffold15308_cov27-Tisochrysis_lutea.AAC.3
MNVVNRKAVIGPIGRLRSLTPSSSVMLALVFRSSVRLAAVLEHADGQLFPFALGLGVDDSWARLVSSC